LPAFLAYAVFAAEALGGRRHQHDRWQPVVVG
jgi:hypothetical protein